MLELRDVSVKVGHAENQRILFAGLNLKVHEGEHCGIIGLSGAGKTTLLTLLGLIKQPTTGEVLINGCETARARDTQLSTLRNSSLGFVFQDYSLIPHLSVLSNLLVPFEYAPTKQRVHARARAMEQLDAVGLAHCAERNPMSLSGGEQQRVAIARALVRDPSIVLADEPTGALDEETAERVLAHLKAATKGNGTALVVVTHNPRVAHNLDRVLSLSGGSLQQVEHRQTT